MMVHRIKMHLLCESKIEDPSRKHVGKQMGKKALEYMESGYDKLRQHIKKQRHHFANKDPYNQSYGFSSSHVWM